MDARFGGKQPRYGGKQPRRPVASDSDSDDDDDDDDDDEEEDDDFGAAAKGVGSEEDPDDGDESGDDDEDWGSKKKPAAKKTAKKGPASAKKTAASKRKAPAAKKSGGGSKKKRRADSSDEDEGDDAAEGDDDNEDDEDDETEFDEEKLYLSGADRQKLEAMNEIERESILLERHEKRIKELQKARTIRDLRRKKAAALAARGGKQTASEATATLRRESSQKRRTGTEALRLSAAQRARQDMAAKKKSKAQAAASKFDDDDDDFSDEDDDDAAASGMSDEEDDEDGDGEAAARPEAAGEGEMDEDDEEEDDDEDEGGGGARGRRSGHVGLAAEDMEEAWPDEANGGLGLTDVNKIRIPRTFLEKQLEEPYLGRALQGCLVRYLIGAYSGEAIYRLCEVRGVEEAPKPYRLPGLSGDNRRASTTVMLRVKHGIHENSIRVDKVSNHRFTQSELDKWVVAMRDSRQAPISRAECQRRHDRLKAITNNHTYTAEEVREMVERRSRSAISSGHHNLAQLRIKLSNEQGFAEEALRAAVQKRDRVRDKQQHALSGFSDEAETEAAEAAVAACEAAVARLLEDQRKLKAHSAAKAAAYSSADKLSQVNSRNKAANVEVDGADSRATLADEFLGTGGGGGGGGDYDGGKAMFRKTRTTMSDLWATKRSDADKAKDVEASAKALSKVFGGFAGNKDKGEGGKLQGRRGRGKHGKGNTTNGGAPQYARSKTGLRRRVGQGPRSRRGISLQTYLEQARMQATMEEEEEGQGSSSGTAAAQGQDRAADANAVDPNTPIAQQ